MLEPDRAQTMMLRPYRSLAVLRIVETVTYERKSERREMHPHLVRDAGLARDACEKSIARAPHDRDPSQSVAGRWRKSHARADRDHAARIADEMTYRGVGHERIGRGRAPRPGEVRFLDGMSLEALAPRGKRRCRERDHLAPGRSRVETVRSEGGLRAGKLGPRLGKTRESPVSDRREIEEPDGMARDPRGLVDHDEAVPARKNRDGELRIALVQPGQVPLEGTHVEGGILGETASLFQLSARGKPHETARDGLVDLPRGQLGKPRVNQLVCPRAHAYIHTRMRGPREVKEWATFLKRLRAFFDARGLYEVTTDHVVPAGAFESTIDTLKVSWRGGSGELHTSPEIEMKGLLAADGLSIYQICRCFRDDPATPIHLREFTMLEYYRVGVEYRALIADMRELFEELAGKSLPFETLTVREAVLRHAGIDLSLARDTATLRRAIDEKRSLVPSPDDDWADLFFKLLIEKVEPALDPARPTILTDYPAELSPLSKPSGDVAERFEIYWRGMELCNGCTELDDAAELRRRFRKQSAERAARGLPPHPVPERLVAALDRGLPPCAGVAVGLERLFTCLASA